MAMMVRLVDEQKESSYEGIVRTFAKVVAEEVAKLMKRDEEPERRYDESEMELSSDQHPGLVRGLSGIQEIFKCSKSAAFQIKSSGVIDDAITYISPKIFLVDPRKAIAIYKAKMGNKGRILKNLAVR